MPLPMPTKAHMEADGPDFEPCPDLSAWVGSNFLTQGSKLFAPDHLHLLDATVGFVFTNIPKQKAYRDINGEAALGLISGDKWLQGLRAHQYVQWFEEVPNFVITLYSGMWTGPETDDLSRLALLEHELYHCCIKINKKTHAQEFDRATGNPLWDIRGHDVEQFVGVVERYGAAAAGVEALVAAANRKPTIGCATIALSCGTCR